MHDKTELLLEEYNRGFDAGYELGLTAVMDSTLLERVKFLFKIH